MARTTTTLLAILLLATPAFAWDQVQGDSARSARFATQPGPWDVVEVRSVEGAAWPPTGPGILPMGTSAVGVFRSGDGSCLRWQWGGDPQPMADCKHGSLQAVIGGDIIICSWGPTGALERRSATGVTWSIPLRPLLNSTSTDTTAGCDGVAHDRRGTLYVPVVLTRSGTDARDHAIVAIDAGSGATRWQTVLPPSQAPGFRPWAATVTTTGIGVVGTSQCILVPGCTGSTATRVATVAWLDLSGDLQGTRTASGRTDGSVWASADGARLALRLGGDVLAADPLAPGQARTARVDPLSGAMNDPWQQQGPVATADHILVPLRDQLAAVSWSSLERTWTWNAPAGYVVHGVAVASNEISVLAWRPTGASGKDTVWGAEAILARLASDGTTRQIIPLPLHGMMVSEPALSGTASTYLRARGASFAPIDGGFLLAGADGRVARLTSSTTGLDAIPSTYFPASGAPVTITIARDGWIAWGDGAFQQRQGPTETASLSHTYFSSGPKRLTFAADHADGTTKTSVRTIHVDAVPRDHATLDGPPVRTSDPYATGPFSINVTVWARTHETFIDWGDGTRERRTGDAPIRAQHTYAEGTRRDGSITTVSELGVVATTPFFAHPGGTPPKPGFFERAFAPENQDMTWGIIGVAVALIGGTTTLLLRRRRGRSIGQILTRIEEVRQASRNDPIAALPALVSIRREQRDRLHRGRIDEGQFSIIRDRCQDVMRRITATVVDPLRAELSPELLARLDAALVDGMIDERESSELRVMLASEQMAQAEHERLEEFLIAWTG